jgi:hypothetical protein
MLHFLEPPSVYQFRIVLQGISPLIWRCLLVSSETTLAHLHDILQIAFAWSDTHLHCFHIHDKEYGRMRLGGPSFDADPRYVRLTELRLHRREQFAYIYNFIDHWECDLRLETILPCDGHRRYPVCIGGKRAAPPEDCGGAWPYIQHVDQHDLPMQAMSIVATALEHIL